MKRVLSLAGVLALVAVGLAGVASPAAAVACSDTPYDVSIPGGESHYTVTCDNYGYTIVDGWLTDTKADGKCVQVKAQIYSEWFYSNKACPKGEVEYFHWKSPKPTSYASVWTYTVG